MGVWGCNPNIDYQSANRNSFGKIEPELANKPPEQAIKSGLFFRFNNNSPPPPPVRRFFGGIVHDNTPRVQRFTAAEVSRQIGVHIPAQSHKITYAAMK